jgi:transposase-like protein
MLAIQLHATVGQTHTQTALRFLTKVIGRHGVPKTITIDGSEANTAAIKLYNEAHGTNIIIRQVKYNKFKMVFVV